MVYEVRVAVDVVELVVRQTVRRAISVHVKKTDFVVAIEPGGTVIVGLCGRSIWDAGGAVGDIDRGSATPGAVTRLVPRTVTRITKGLVVVVEAELRGGQHRVIRRHRPYTQPHGVGIDEFVDDFSKVRFGRARTRLRLVYEWCAAPSSRNIIVARYAVVVCVHRSGAEAEHQSGNQPARQDETDR